MGFAYPGYRGIELWKKSSSVKLCFFGMKITSKGKEIFEHQTIQDSFWSTLFCFPVGSRLFNFNCDLADQI